VDSKFQAIIDDFVCWGKSSDRLYAALIIGSEARKDRPADEYSDLDIVMIVDDPVYFLSSDQWLEGIGSYCFSFVENTLAGGQEKRVLFDSALDVDFVILPKDMISDLDSDALAILGRGYNILIDKIDLKNSLPPLVVTKKPYKLVSEQDFINIVNDFWYHTVWTAKKLKRGELWTAKMCLDSYLKWKILPIIECHAHIIHGLDYDTWHRGRFIEEWAEPWVIEELSLCFSRYHKEDIKNALFATMDLFRTIAREVAEKLGYKYPLKADEYTTRWVKTALNYTDG